MAATIQIIRQVSFQKQQNGYQDIVENRLLCATQAGIVVDLLVKKWYVDYSNADNETYSK